MEGVELGSSARWRAGQVQIAGRLRAETMMPLQWIGQRLHIGTKSHLAHLVVL
jgi:hypothetical protein